MSTASDTQDVKCGIEQGGARIFVKSGAEIDVESGGALKIAGVDKTAAVAGLPATTNYAVGVAAGYKVARGQHTMLSALDTIATGLTAVVAIVASLESDPILTCDRASAAIGDQSSAPVAGSAYLKVWMPTTEGDTHPIAATGYAGIKVNWVAVGT